MFNVNVLAANIKKFRIAKGLSQSALANALLITPQSVSKWECGASVPDIENLCAISDFLGVSLDALLSHSSERKKIMIGIDGGGTKTDFVMFTEDGAILETCSDGPCNPNSIGVEACVGMLINGINSLLSANSGVCGIYIGSAGFLLGNNAAEIKKILKRHYPHIKITCATDMLNVAASATVEDNCIAAICGTGSAVLVKEGEKLTLLGGWGYLLSKSGSGYDIGRDCLHAAMGDINGLAPHTKITSLVSSKIGNNISDIIANVYGKDQSFIASFATCVFEAYQAGDEVAKKILHENAKAISEHINIGFKNYSCGNKLVLAGGIITKNQIFADIMKQYLNPDIDIIIPKYPQVLGACVMCAKRCGVSTEGLIENLARQYAKESTQICLKQK